MKDRGIHIIWSMVLAVSIAVTAAISSPHRSPALDSVLANQNRMLIEYEGYYPPTGNLSEAIPPVPLMRAQRKLDALHRAYFKAKMEREIEEAVAKARVEVQRKYEAAK